MEERDMPPECATHQQYVGPHCTAHFYWYVTLEDVLPTNTLFCIQGSNLLTKPYILVAECSKKKYFPLRDYLSFNLGPNPSFI